MNKEDIVDLVADTNSPAPEMEPELYVPDADEEVPCYTFRASDQK